MYSMDYCALMITGNSAHFLNGLTSNTLDKPFNAFLNQHGRVIATAFVKQYGPDAYVVVVSRGALKALLEHLSRYAKLNRSQIDSMEANVYLQRNDDSPLPMDAISINLGEARLVISRQLEGQRWSENEFNQFRLDHHLPLMGIDYGADEFILNIDQDRYVSFTKGCFLGQEPVAKVHHRAKPSWKLVVAYEDAVNIANQRDSMSSCVKDPLTGRMRGFVFVRNI